MRKKAELDASAAMQLQAKPDRLSQPEDGRVDPVRLPCRRCNAAPGASCQTVAGRFKHEAHFERLEDAAELVEIEAAERRAEAA